MSKTSIGNKEESSIFYTDYEIELDDDEHEDIEGDVIIEQEILGYQAVCPKGSQTTSVKIFYYILQPKTEWYWDYAYGTDLPPLVPVVFAADSTWRLTECLNATFEEIPQAGRQNGWIEMNVTLKRRLVKNENIVFGVYSDTIVANGSDFNDYDKYYFNYYSKSKRINYTSPIAYVSSNEFLLNQKCYSSDQETCIFLEYENETEAMAYTRTVLGNVSPSSLTTRKSNWKRPISTIGVIDSATIRKGFYKKNCNSTFQTTEAATRKVHNYRLLQFGKRFTDKTSRKHYILRWLENTNSLNDLSQRLFTKRITASDELSFLDFVRNLHVIICTCFSRNKASDKTTRLTDYKKKITSLVDDSECVTRTGSYYKSLEDSATLDAMPFASRLFYRAVKTVMNFWDWLRGKIRETNNVITIFCPVDLEIKLECKV